MWLWVDLKSNKEQEEERPPLALCVDCKTGRRPTSDLCLVSYCVLCDL